MMKTRITFIAIVLLVSITLSTTADAQKVKLTSTEDSLSYALGVANYNYYLKDSININAKAFMKGMSDASKDKAVMDETAASGFVVKYMQARESRNMEKLYKTQIEAGKKYLSENATKEGIVVTASGLQYKIINLGSGEKPGPESVVKVNYKGTTIEGKKFDSSYDRNEPATFNVGNVIKGWQQGLQLMPAGSKFIFYVPYQLAYGERGAGNIIKPFETLVFEVELIEIVKE